MNIKMEYNIKAMINCMNLSIKPSKSLLLLEPLVSEARHEKN